MILNTFQLVPSGVQVVWFSIIYYMIIFIKFEMKAKGCSLVILFTFELVSSGVQKMQY